MDAGSTDGPRPQDGGLADSGLGDAATDASLTDANSVDASLDAGDTEDLDAASADSGEDAGHDAGSGASLDSGVFDAGPRDDRPNIVFVTSARHHLADAGALTGLDEICRRHANAASLPGRFVAFVSTSSASAIERLGDSRGWVRPDGRPVLDLPTDISWGKSFYAPALDEFGSRAIRDPDAGTSYSDFQFVTTGWSGRTCDDWTNPNETTTVGMSTDAYFRWLTWLPVFCSRPAFYCFEVGKTFPVQPYAPDPHRIAFITWGWVPPHMGLAGMDDICNTEAAGSGLSGSFVALVATVGATASSRLTEGPPWYRPDDVLVFNSLDEILSDALPVAPISTTAGGLYDRSAPDNRFTETIMTGAEGVNLIGTADTTCDNWTTEDAQRTRFSTTAGIGSRNWFSDGALTSCQSLQRVFCFQQ